MPARQFLQAKKKPGLQFRAWFDLSEGSKSNEQIMHQLVPTNNPVTMTSLELVDYINSQRGPEESELRHRDFCAKVPKVLGEEMCEKFRASFKDAYGRDQPGYRFPKREACLMAMSYSYELQAKVYDYMTELEAAQAKPAELSRMDILKLAMESEQARIEAEKQLALAAPKVEFVDRYVEATGLFTFREVAKLLKANEARFREFLLVEKIMYRLGTGGKLTAYQNHVDAGRFEMKTDTAKNGHSYRNSMFTPKGVHWIAGEWAKANLQEAA